MTALLPSFEQGNYVHKRGINLLVGDWTSQNPDITAILTRYGRAGVPLYLYFPADAGTGDAKILPQILTPGLIETEIERADKKGGGAAV